MWLSSSQKTGAPAELPGLDPRTGICPTSHRMVTLTAVAPENLLWLDRPGRGGGWTAGRPLAVGPDTKPLVDVVSRAVALAVDGDLGEARNAGCWWSAIQGPVEDMLGMPFASPRDGWALPAGGDPVRTTDGGLARGASRMPYCGDPKRALVVIDQTSCVGLPRSTAF